MTVDQLQTIVTTLQRTHRMDFEATREGEGAGATHTYEQVEESKELTLPKLDQVDQVDGGGGAAGTAGAAEMFEATREGEVAAPAHTY